MQGTRPAQLFAAASLAALAAALPFGAAALAQSRDAQLCATQSDGQADQRIAACSRMIEFGPPQRQAGRRRL